jgi:hypothetical protein
LHGPKTDNRKGRMAAARTKHDEKASKQPGDSVAAAYESAASAALLEVLSGTHGESRLADCPLSGALEHTSPYCQLILGRARNCTTLLTDWKESSTFPPLKKSCPDCAISFHNQAWYGCPPDLSYGADEFLGILPELVPCAHWAPGVISLAGRTVSAVL